MIRALVLLGLMATCSVASAQSVRDLQGLQIERTGVCEASDEPMFTWAYTRSRAQANPALPQNFDRVRVRKGRQVTDRTFATVSGNGLSFPNYQITTRLKFCGEFPHAWLMSVEWDVDQEIDGFRVSGGGAIQKAEATLKLEYTNRDGDGQLEVHISTIERGHSDALNTVSLTNLATGELFEDNIYLPDLKNSLLIRRLPLHAAGEQQ